MMKERKFNTQNYLISDRDIQDFYNDNVTGGMQSYHEMTGASIACTAEFNGMNFIAVVLGAVRTFAENGWQPVYYGNFNEISVFKEINCFLNRVNSVFVNLFGSVFVVKLISVFVNCANAYNSVI